MKIKPCRKCGSTDLNVWDCGYSSFNVGGVKCNGCKHEVRVSPCGLDPKKELIRAWNKDKPNVQEQRDTLLAACKLKLEAFKGKVYDPEAFDIAEKACEEAIAMCEGK